MKEVRIKKQTLLDILKKNRQEHRDIFLAAQKEYRKQAIKVLDEQLSLAREGKPFVLATVTALIAPEDHTKDYDRAVEMLELSEDEVITLSTADFSNLVQDQWSWSRQWAFSNSHYVDSPKFRSVEEE
jgi:hypothetical protein